jgi:hypothetical protein
MTVLHTLPGESSIAVRDTLGKVARLGEEALRARADEYDRPGTFRI